MAEGESDSDLAGAQGHIQFNKAATPMWGKPSVLVYRRFNAEHILDRRFNAEHIRRECLPNISTAELTPFICGIRQRNENFSNLFEIGGRDMTTASYDVGGVISPRPFRLRRLGHIGYDVDHLDDTLDFFVRDLGLGVSDVLDLRLLPGLEQVVSNVADPRLVFLTPANDHHSIVLIPRQAALAFRDPLVPADMTNDQISFQLASIEEVIAAKSYLEKNGVPVLRMGRDFPAKPGPSRNGQNVLRRPPTFTPTSRSWGRSDNLVVEEDSAVRAFAKSWTN